MKWTWPAQGAAGVAAEGGSSTQIRVCCDTQEGEDSL